MKKHLGYVMGSFVALFAAVVLLVGCDGCATTGGGGAGNTNVTAIVQDACTLSHVVTPTAIDLALQYAESKPDQRLELESEINAVAVALSALATNGTYDVTAVTNALKAKDPYLNLVLSAVSGLYRGFYGKLTQNGQAASALQILECLSSDAAEATTPPKVIIAKEKALARYPGLRHPVAGAPPAAP